MYECVCLWVCMYLCVEVYVCICKCSCNLDTSTVRASWNTGNRSDTEDPKDKVHVAALPASGAQPTVREAEGKS